VWLKNDSFSFGAISDDTNHMSESCWTVTKEIFAELVQRKSVTTINIISDSPVSQFRNKTTIYLMQKFTTTHDVDFRWVFLESGHGKGVADAVGAVLKRSFDEAVSSDPDNSFHNALDLMSVVKSRTAVKLFIYDKTSTEQLRKSIPALETIKGTAAFHEIIAKRNGTVFAKKLSNEAEQQVKIRVRG
jgi:hypothetical protein